MEGLYAYTPIAEHHYATLDTNVYLPRLLETQKRSDHCNKEVDPSTRRSKRIDKS